MKHSKLGMDQRGLSIVEVLVCVVIVGFMSMSIASMMTSANNANRNITMTLEATSVTQLLTMLLSDRNFCDNNFTKNNVVDIDLTKLATLTIPINKMTYVPVAGQPPPEVIFDRAAPKTPKNSILINDMYLSDIKSLNAGLQVGKLNIVFDKGTSTAGPALVTRNLYMRLETTTVATNVVRVLHCNTLGSVVPPDTTSGGTTPPPDQQEIDDKLFQNLISGLRTTPIVSDKVNLVMDMITQWQKLGLVSSTGRYMTIAKFNSLVMDGGVIDTINQKGDLCQFFSGKVIDVQNAPLTRTIITQTGGTACSVYLAK